MGTSFFENAVNAGLPHRGCVINAGLPHRGCIINAGPTQVTRVDNALLATQGHVAMLPKKATLQRCHHVESRALSTRGDPQWVALTTHCPSKGLALTIVYMKILCQRTKTCLCDLAGFSPC